MKLCRSDAEREADGKIPKKFFCLGPTMCDGGTWVWLEYVWMTEALEPTMRGTRWIKRYKLIEEKRMYV